MKHYLLFFYSRQVGRSIFTLLQNKLIEVTLNMQNIREIKKSDSPLVRQGCCSYSQSGPTLYIILNTQSQYILYMERGYPLSNGYVRKLFLVANKLGLQQESCIG